MITISDLQRLQSVINISGLAQLVFGDDEKIARSLRDKVRYGRELDASDAIKIYKTCKRVGLIIEHREQE